MTFAVQPGWLGGYAGQVSRGSDDAARVKHYLNEYTVDGDWNGTLIWLVGNATVQSTSTAAALEF